MTIICCRTIPFSNMTQHNFKNSSEFGPWTIEYDNFQHVACRIMATMLKHQSDFELKKGPHASLCELEWKCLWATLHSLPKSHAMGTRKEFQLEILTINVISGIVHFRGIILESSLNVREIKSPISFNRDNRVWLCFNTDQYINIARYYIPIDNNNNRIRVGLCTHKR